MAPILLPLQVETLATFLVEPSERLIISLIGDQLLVISSRDMHDSFSSPNETVVSKHCNLAIVSLQTLRNMWQLEISLLLLGSSPETEKTQMICISATEAPRLHAGVI